MYVKNIFINKNRLRAFWRIIVFVILLFLAISPLFLLVNTHLQFAGAVSILIFGLYLNSKYLDKRNFIEYGLIFRKQILTYFIIGILIGAISVVLMLLIGKAMGIISVHKVSSTPKYILIIPFAFKMLLVAILEEAFFRGYLFTNLYEGFKSKKRSPKKALLIALVVSSLLFGLAHFNNSNASILSMALLTINGMVWCIPFILTKNLGLSIGLHTAWNFTQTQLGFTMSGNQALNSFYTIENNGSIWLTGGGYGPEAGILGLAAFVAMLLISLTYLKLTKRG